MPPSVSEHVLSLSLLLSILSDMNFVLFSYFEVDLVVVFSPKILRKVRTALLLRPRRVRRVERFVLDAKALTEARKGRQKENQVRRRVVIWLK